MIVRHLLGVHAITASSTNNRSQIMRVFSHSETTVTPGPIEGSAGANRSCEMASIANLITNNTFLTLISSIYAPYFYGLQLRASWR